MKFNNRRINGYWFMEVFTSNQEINFNNFYKFELVQMLEILKNNYKIGEYVSLGSEAREKWLKNEKERLKRRS